MFSNDTEFQTAIAQAQREGTWPRGLSSRQLALLEKSFSRYSGQVSERILEKILDDFSGRITHALSMTEPDTIRGIAADLGRFMEPEIADEIKFALDVSQQVVFGAGRYLNQNASPEVVDEYPALALVRLFRRTVPRGYKRVGKTVVPIPDDDWPSRWAEAGHLAVLPPSGKPDWLPWKGDSQTGRGVALKSSGIWIKLGTLRPDSLGNPFPPFAFESGFDTENVSRKDTEALGLIKPGEKASPANLDFEALFNTNF